MSAYDAIEAAIEQCKDDAGADPELLSGALLAEEQLAALCKQIETSQNAVDKLMGDIGRLSIANLEVANLNAALRALNAEAMEILAELATPAHVRARMTWDCTCGGCRAAALLQRTTSEGSQHE